MSVRALPEQYIIVTRSGVRYAQFTARDGRKVLAEITASGKCRVESPVWWIRYTDADGNRCRVPGSRIRSAAEHLMAQLVTDVERIKGGQAARLNSVTSATLTTLAAAYRDHLRDMGRTPKHYEQVYAQISTVLAATGWASARDVNLASWTRWIGRQREAGVAAETLNHYRRSLRGLFRWAKLPGLLEDAEPLNAEADRRVRRRTLSAEEFRRLIDTTRASPKVYVGLDGPSRAALYLFAGRTGFRAGVLASLRREDVRLDDATPNIPTEAKKQKSRKALTVPLSAAFVAEVRGWAESRPAGLLWPGNWHRHHHAARVLRRDLVAAGIPPETAEGTFDLHALRGQCATDLALAGVPLHVTQQFLGHSTPTLTAKHYLKAGLTDLAAAAERVLG